MRIILLTIAIRHLMARKRQSLVSLSGITLGVAFFLAISSMMQGSEADFIKRLVDTIPHIVISDEYRNARPQPVFARFPKAAVELRSVTPVTETRGIRGYARILEYLETLPDLKASPVLNGQALASFAGKDVAIALSGVVPSEYSDVSIIDTYMRQGELSDLEANPNGIIIGDGLVRKLSLRMGKNINLSATTGQVHTFKIVGIFHTGRANYDEGQGIISLKRAQSLLNRPNRVNTIIVKLADPYRARQIATPIEARIGYKSLSWQEASEDIMSSLAIRNVIMYSVVSAVLVVAAFGIYNIISTVVMEKQRDIAILKSMGFHARDIEWIFIVQGALLGIAGSAAGLPLGAAIMAGFMNLEFNVPGSTDPLHLPMDWSWQQFALAGGFAFSAATFAAYLPSRKAARLRPVEILRGLA